MFALFARAVTAPAVPVARFLAERRLRALGDAQALQLKALQSILGPHAGSDFGKRYDFAKVKSLDDWRKAVPLGNHTTLKPYLDRVIGGETQSLFGPGTELLGFTLSSGTTGPKKLIPVTVAAAKALNASWHMWGEFMYTDHPEVIGSPLAQLASDWGGERTPGGLPIGDVSGLLARLQPWFVRWAYCVPYDASKIKDDLLRYQAYLRLAIAEPRVRFVATATPATLVRLAELADESKELLFKDLTDGTLLGKPVASFNLPAAVAAALAKRRGARARALSVAAGKAGALTPRVYWPGLSLVATWTSGTFGHYVAPLRRWYGDVALRDVGLMSSEGHFTVPVEDATAVAPLNSRSHVFEFVPAESAGRDDASTLLAHELEVGRTYSLVVTTAGGLYRYDMEDLVRCAGYLGTTPKLEFLAKAAHVADLTGEKLSAHHVAEALKLVQARLAVPLPRVVLRARVPGLGPPGYELLHEPTTLRGEDLAAATDAALAEINFIYKEHRACGKLAPLLALPIAAGTLGSGGRAAEQAKPQLLIGPGSKSLPGLPA